MVVDRGNADVVKRREHLLSEPDVFVLAADFKGFPRVPAGSDEREIFRRARANGGIFRKVFHRARAHLIS